LKCFSVKHTIRKNYFHTRNIVDAVLKKQPKKCYRFSFLNKKKRKEIEVVRKYFATDLTETVQYAKSRAKTKQKKEERVMFLYLLVFVLSSRVATKVSFIFFFLIYQFFHLWWFDV
jgi:hypothetical protein